jgi:glycosyltransferase involved in cell wall biosynthesis
MIINLIQDIATPHNNVLIARFFENPNVKIKLWYAVENDSSLYQWSSSLSQEHGPAIIYGKTINLKFLKYCVDHSDEKFLIVGWANINTILLTLIFFLLRRPYNQWTDLPDSHSDNLSFCKKSLRWLAYKILYYSKAMIFGVGITSINYFRKLGFSEDRLVNLPIFVEIDEDLPAYKLKGREFLEKYSIDESNFIISSGSRIVFEKGYDLLIRAIALLDKEILSEFKVIIVGSGPQVSELEALVIDLKLESQIVLIKWLPIHEFKVAITNSNVFVHPARIESYGGTILGMALGVPVIGSFQAGAALDRISTGLNGFLYNAEDIQALANFILLLYHYPALRNKMAFEARKTALQWPPSRGMEIIMQYAI